MPGGTSHARSGLWRRTQGIREAALTRKADGGGFGVGAEVTRTAHFLGKRIDYVLRVAAHDPGRLLDMVYVAGPMPMHVTYTFDPHPDGTLASIPRPRRFRPVPPARLAPHGEEDPLLPRQGPARPRTQTAGRSLTTTHLPRTIRGQ